MTGSRVAVNSGRSRDRGHSLRQVGGALVWAWSVGCGGSSDATAPVVPPPPPAVTVAAVRVYPATVALGGTIPRTARVEDANGQPVAGVVPTWSSDNTKVATVSATGLVTGVAVGGTTVRAVAGATTGAAQLEVVDWQWQSITPQFLTCGLTRQKDLYCWGDATVAMAGPTATTQAEICRTQTPQTLTTACFTTPRLMASPPRFELLMVGREHGCGLTADGEAWCWGRNDLGQLGTPSTDLCSNVPCSRTPLPVSGGLRFTALSGYRHTCGLTPSGELWCWGTNEFGALGATGFSGAMSDRPIRAGGDRQFKVVAVGYRHTCAIAMDGLTYCWGRAGGTGSVRLDGPQATVVNGGRAFVVLSAGDAHTCGLLADSTAYCWGQGVEGELGNGADTNAVAPVRVAGGQKYVTISAGHFYTCALDGDGKAWCWGLNFYGSLGIGQAGPVPCGDATCALAPLAVARGIRFVSLVAGNWVTCGVMATGSAYCWGRNYAGGVGNGREDGHNEFAPVGVGGIP